MSAVYWKPFQYTCSVCCFNNTTQQDTTVINWREGKKHSTYNWARDTPEAFRTGLARWSLRTNRTCLSLGTFQTRLSLLHKNRMYTNHLILARLLVTWHSWCTKWTENLSLLDALPWLPSLLVFPQVLLLQGVPILKKKKTDGRD